MADNRGVAYIGPGKVEVQDIDYPKLELQGRARACIPTTSAARLPHGVILQDRLDQHLRLRPAHGPRPHDRARGADPRPRDHRRGDRGRARTSSSSRRATSCSVPFNIACGRCRNCKEGKTGICLNVNPDRPGLGLRLRRHGRLGRRPGRVRDGPLRRLEPAEVPRQGPGDGEDPRPDDAVGHLPDRLPRRVHRGRRRRARRSTSPAPARSASPPRTPRSCWARRS